MSILLSYNTRILIFTGVPSHHRQKSTKGPILIVQFPTIIKCNVITRKQQNDGKKLLNQIKQLLFDLISNDISLI